MTKDIKARVQGQDPNIIPRDINKFIEKEGVSSIYEALAIIIKRTKFITYDLKEELKAKLEDFKLVRSLELKMIKESDMIITLSCIDKKWISKKYNQFESVFNHCESN